jgi:hypothetical protein
MIPLDHASWACLAYVFGFLFKPDIPRARPKPEKNQARPTSSEDIPHSKLQVSTAATILKNSQKIGSTLVQVDSPMNR